MLFWQLAPRGTTPACMMYLGQNYHFGFTPHSCSIMTFPQRGTPCPLHPIVPVQPQGRWKTHGNTPFQRVSKIRRPKLFTDETWTERQSKLTCNSCLSLCKACSRSPATFFMVHFQELFLCSPSIYYTIKIDGEKCSSLRWEGFIWNTK